ncbi:hypothetical protein [Neisseria wadsworthii]|uniref:hypothetical protein n=1 Tax=Neisseria wadsworthii TaxID=607711 RepID=UPI000D324742|nr:hypothetical protein [Neisseria wadsworthii]
MNETNVKKPYRSPTGSPFARVSQAINLRIGYKDLDAIKAAAEGMGLPMATFIRMAAVEKAKKVRVKK